MKQPHLLHRLLLFIVPHTVLPPQCGVILVYIDSAEEWKLLVCSCIYRRNKQKKQNKSKQIHSSEITPHGILSVNRQGFCSSVVSWLSNTTRSLIAVMRYWTAWSQNSPHQYNHGYCCVPLEWKINVRCWNRNHSAAIAFFFSLLVVLCLFHNLCYVPKLRCWTCDPEIIIYSNAKMMNELPHLAW